MASLVQKIPNLESLAFINFFNHLSRTYISFKKKEGYYTTTTIFVEQYSKKIKGTLGSM